MADIGAPLFVVGTESDHVAPWRSVFKINLLADTEVTFLLTSGGHNAGIVSEPDHRWRHYRIATQHEGDTYLDPDGWLETFPEKPGSWWPEWQAWLAAHSGAPVAPPGFGAAGYPPLMEAPGSYVLQP